MNPYKKIGLGILLLLGLFRGIFWQFEPPNHYFFHQVKICGVVRFPSDRILECLSIGGKNVSGKLKVQIQKTIPTLSVGDELCTEGTIQPIRNFGVPGEFDQEKYWHTRGVWGKLRVKHFSIQPNVKRFWIASQRHKFSLFLNRSAEAPLLKALVLGMTSDLTPETKKMFIHAGLYHVLVISGFHVSLFLACIFQSVVWLLLRWDRLLLAIHVQKVAMVLSFALLGFYIFLTGASMPILRAAIMAFFGVCSQWCGQSYFSGYAWLWSAAFILNGAPASLTDPSFQLSWVAYGGVVAGLQIARNRHWAIQAISSTLGAMLMTGPILAVHFHQGSWTSWVSNLACLPLVSFVIMPLCFGILFLYFFYSPLAGLLILGLDPILQGWVWLAQFFSKMPYAFMYVYEPHFTQVVLWYGFLGLSFYFWIKKQRFMAGGFFCFFILFMVLSVQIRLLIKNHFSPFRVTFLSVGQGDSSVIELPHGKTMLIDTGGLWGLDVGERLLVPYFMHRLIGRIDVLVLSHGDFDHIQGALFLLKTLPVGEIWLSQDLLSSKTGMGIIELAEKQHVPIYFPEGSFQFSNTQFDILNPKHSFQGGSRNNQSLVIRMRHQDLSILFTGDIETAVENELRDGALQSTILKVPHHGSKTSSSLLFLKKVKPKLAVISAGFHNLYHHPHRAVLKRYQALGIPIWRTDLQGTLTLDAMFF
ncbi:MAG: DNA internalization-related competence protein ComEC/Rec2 [Deltaproteobacteria bacterium]|nr:DNA internalization-related competence protein ComEC/Rec2 [Deltaproteobacteria bacterium]